MHILVPISQRDSTVFKSQRFSGLKKKEIAFSNSVKRSIMPPSYVSDRSGGAQTSYSHFQEDSKTSRNGWNQMILYFAEVCDGS